MLLCCQTICAASLLNGLCCFLLICVVIFLSRCTSARRQYRVTSNSTPFFLFQVYKFRFLTLGGFRLSPINSVLGHRSINRPISRSIVTLVRLVTLDIGTNFAVVPSIPLPELSKLCCKVYQCGKQGPYVPLFVALAFVNIVDVPRIKLGGKTSITFLIFPHPPFYTANGVMSLTSQLEYALSHNIGIPPTPRFLVE